jgi:hypothetical protein
LREHLAILARKRVDLAIGAVGDEDELLLRTVTGIFVALSVLTGLVCACLMPSRFHTFNVALQSHSIFPRCTAACD